MPPRKNKKKKNEMQTESENDTNDGTEEEMEADDSVDGSCSLPPTLGLTRSPMLNRKENLNSSMPDLTSRSTRSSASSDYSNRSGQKQSLSSNNSSIASDYDNSPSPVSTSTDHRFGSSPSQLGPGTTSPFSLFDDLPKRQPEQPTESKKDESVQPSAKDVKHSKDVSQNSWNLVPVGLQVIIVFAFVAIFFAMYIGNSSLNSKPVASFNQFETFVQNIDNFKPLFPAQENRFWRTVKASGKHVLNVSNPDYPAILLFVTKSKPANGDKFDVGTCLARKISAEFDSASMVVTSGSPIVDVGKLTTGSTNKQKMEFDDQLRSFLENNYKSVIVEHLELLSPTAALLLHGYCDNDNAPYKDVMIIMVLHVENDNISPRAAEAMLKQSWERELETDKVDALMSRVANNIVIVHPESIASSSVTSLCA